MPLPDLPALLLDTAAATVAFGALALLARWIVRHFRLSWLFLAVLLHLGFLVVLVGFLWVQLGWPVSLAALSLLVALVHLGPFPTEGPG